MTGVSEDQNDATVGKADTHVHKTGRTQEEVVLLHGLGVDDTEITSYIRVDNSCTL